MANYVEAIRGVYETRNPLLSRGEVAEQAEKAGFSRFMFNGRIYLIAESDYYFTGQTIESLTINN